jgi:hypothetical protein
MLDPVFETSIRKPALSASTQEKIKAMRKHAAAELKYYLQKAVPGVDWLPEALGNYFKRWLDAEASYYEELIPTDEEIEVWLHDLTERTLNHQHGSSRGREFEPELLARKSYWSAALQKSRFGGTALLAHFLSAAEGFQFELNRARSNLRRLATDSTDLTALDSDNAVLVAITRFFEKQIIHVLRAFQGATSRSIPYAELAATLEQCFLVSLEGSPTLWSSSLILSPFIFGVTWLDKEKKAEIRKACREVMVQYEVKLSLPLEDVGEAPPNPRLESQRRKEAVDEFIRRVRQVTGHK